jgi:hypothetical protein
VACTSVPAVAWSIRHSGATRPQTGGGTSFDEIVERRPQRDLNDMCIVNYNRSCRNSRIMVAVPGQPAEKVMRDTWAETSRMAKESGGRLVSATNAVISASRTTGAGFAVGQWSCKQTLGAGRSTQQVGRFRCTYRCLRTVR